MKKVIFISLFYAFVLVILSPAEVFAQKETYDLITYTPPKGWKKEEKPSYVVYSTAKLKSYCMLVIYKSANGLNNITSDFASEWKQFAATPYNITAQPNLQEIEKENGWTSQTGGATFSNNGGNNILLLATSSGYNKVVSIMIITNDTGYMNSIEKFSNSIQLNKPMSNPVNINTPVIASGTKADVWMNVQSNALYGGGGYWSFTDAIRIKFYFVYHNGDYCSEMPLAGLQTFDKEKSKSSGERTWGKFSMQNDNGTFVSQYENIKVKKVSATKMEKVGYTYSFYKCASVDGLKLNSAWSSIPNWTKDPYYSQAGCRQVIYFKPDGSFDDHGIFVADCRYPDRHAQDAPGKGSYSISNFTLVLKYDDGRLVYKAFTGVADKNPVTDNEVIFIGTNPFYKK
jgi:hypothetical protein